MNRQRGMTYMETILSGFLIIAGLAVLSKMMILPLEYSTAMSPQAQALQRTQQIAQDQVEQLRAADQQTGPLIGTFVATTYGYYAPIPPRPTPPGTDPSLHVALIDELAVIRPATVNQNFLLMNSCATMPLFQSVQVGIGATAEFLTPQAAVRGENCQIVFTANASQTQYYHGPGTPVLPVDANHTVFHQYLTALATSPLYRTTLATDALLAATEIVLTDRLQIGSGTWLRLGEGALAETVRAGGMTENTVQLQALPTRAHAAGEPVALATRLAAAISAGDMCLRVEDPSLFSANSGVQVDLSTVMESEVVACVGAACKCLQTDATTAAATGDTIQLVRPLLRPHSAGTAVVPATFSTASFDLVGNTAGGQRLGI